MIMFQHRRGCDFTLTVQPRKVLFKVKCFDCVQLISTKLALCFGLPHMFSSLDRLDAFRPRVAAASWSRLRPKHVFPQQQNFATGSLAQISSGAIRCSFNTRFRARFRRVQGCGADTWWDSRGLRCRYVVRFRKFPVKVLGEVPEGYGEDVWWGSGNFQCRYLVKIPGDVPEGSGEDVWWGSGGQCEKEAEAFKLLGIAPEFIFVASWNVKKHNCQKPSCWYCCKGMAFCKHVLPQCKWIWAWFPLSSYCHQIVNHRSTLLIFLSSLRHNLSYYSSHPRY